MALADAPVEGICAYWLEKPKPIGGRQATRMLTFADALDGHGLELATLRLQLEGAVLHTPTGAVHKTDVVAFETPGHSIAVGFAKKLLQHADGSHWCLLHVLEWLEGAAFNKANGKDMLIPAAAVRGTFPHFTVGQRVYVIAPIDLIM